MFLPYLSFQEPVILDPEEHKELKVRMPSDFSFCQNLETVPLCFSELLSVSMYYPVFFGVQEGEIFPFAVLGLNRKNLYLNSEGNFKVEVIPRMLKSYPFSVIKRKGDEGSEWIVILDKIWLTDDGERIFKEDGTETPFFTAIKEELTELAHDLQRAYNFCKELQELGLLKLLPSLTINLKMGSAVFKNVLIADVENLARLQPEKVYYLNISGYLPIIYSLYLSVRNIKLFDLINGGT